MNKRGTGLGFCAIAAFLFASRYIAAAIFGSGLQSWSDSLFASMMYYVGNRLTVLSVVALLVGIGYLLMAEIERE